LAKASFFGADTSLRIFIKATSWRVFATCDTILLSYIFTGHIGAALKIGLSEVGTKIGLFYVHERFLLGNIRFGRLYAEDKKTVIGEKHYRSILKGMSWRFFGTIDTMMLAFFWTGNYKAAFAIGATEVVTKVGLFWLHERVWFGIKWGKVKTVGNKNVGVLPTPVVVLNNSSQRKAAVV
jgi:uncharacterized membrane protein